MRLLSAVKQILVPAGTKKRIIRGGLCKNLSMQIDFKHQTQFYLGLYEREIHSWLRRFSRDIRTAADVGTAEGIYTLFFLGQTGAQKVFCFEPLEIARAEMIENLRLNNFFDPKRVIISPKFVGEKESQDTCTLDASLLPCEEPCLIKIDIEGAETAALRGAKRLLSMPRVRWIIETHGASVETECLDILKKAGYRTKIIPNAWWRAIVPENRFGHNRWIAAAKEGEGLL